MKTVIDLCNYDNELIRFVVNKNPDDEYEKFIILFKKLYLLQYSNDDRLDILDFKHLDFISKFEENILIEKTKNFKENLYNLINSEYKLYMINDVIGDIEQLLLIEDITAFYKEVENIFQNFKPKYTNDGSWSDYYEINDFNKKYFM